jgi:rod shape-determining protein MreC
VLVAFSFYLVFSHNSYHRSVYFTSANSLTGWLYDKSNSVRTYFYLHKNNRELLERNAKLESELYVLKELYHRDYDSISTTAFALDSVKASQFRFIPAEVSYLSFSAMNNYITLNKGLADGVKPDMGVISQRGVVGVVFKASEHFSAVIPIINAKFRLSAKLKNSGNYGSLSWDGSDIYTAQLQELPKHEVYQEGDTVLTSFSRIFPKGLVIGYVSGKAKSQNDNFNSFDVKLATNFYTIQDVLIIEDSYYTEQNQLEQSIRQ